ncbi:ORF1 [callitrichine gammaherpesvirus 3]|uniref:ORF1 n=1 Tax=callitrichine gammaherpesvirus 3 TaxID=106331 RepID=Q993L0_9GAMA|nr:ORF1 [callitrichine gammaherpesvirus 3]AAK38208.1 ORF1 [callitrichine gammaherpesvirus 3]
MTDDVFQDNAPNLGAEDEMDRGVLLLTRVMIAAYLDDPGKGLGTEERLFLRLIKRLMKKEEKRFADIVNSGSAPTTLHGHIKRLMTFTRAIYEDHMDNWFRVRALTSLAVAYARRNIPGDSENAGLLLVGFAEFLCLYRRAWLSRLGGIRVGLRRAFPLTWMRMRVGESCYKQ